MLARLETMTRDRLRPLAERLGLDTTVDPKDVADGEALAARPERSGGFAA